MADCPFQQRLRNKGNCHPKSIRRPGSRPSALTARPIPGDRAADARAKLWIAQAIDAKNRGDEAFLKDHHYPGIAAGTEGVRWLENCVRSAEGGSVWVDFK